jgi:hypothetical protein
MLDADADRPDVELRVRRVVAHGPLGGFDGLRRRLTDSGSDPNFCGQHGPATGSLVLDRETAGPNVDVEPLRLLVFLIKLVAEHGDDDDERSDDEIEDVVARHVCDLHLNQYRRA